MIKSLGNSDDTTVQITEGNDDFLHVWDSQKKLELEHNIFIS